MSLTRFPMPTSELLNPASALLARVFPGLSDAESLALDDISDVHRFISRDTRLVSEGEHSGKLRLMCAGWAMRSVGLSENRRQIVGFVLPGDLVGLNAWHRLASFCDVTSITPCEVAEFDLGRVLEIAADYPVLANSIRAYMARDAVILSDQVRRLGRMTAYERVCHFLLEIFDRQLPLDASPAMVDFRITQSAAADALGLSVVHVNRQVMRLRRQGLVSLDRRSLCIHDVDELRRISGYESRAFAAGAPTEGA